MNFSKNNQKSTWTQFRASGFLWLINTILHAFGWTIVLEPSENRGEDFKAYIYKTKWRGFSRDSNDNGYKNIARYLNDPRNTDFIMEAFEYDNKEGDNNEFK